MKNLKHFKAMTVSLSLVVIANGFYSFNMYKIGLGITVIAMAILIFDIYKKRTFKF